MLVYAAPDTGTVHTIVLSLKLCSHLIAMQLMDILISNFVQIIELQDIYR